MLVASLATMQLANWSLTARQTQMVSPATQPTSWNARQWLDLAVEEYLAGNWQRARKHFQIALVRPDAVSLTNSIERYKLEALLLLADSNPAAAQTPLSRWMALQPEAYWLYQFAGIKAAHRQYTQAARLYAEAARLGSVKFDPAQKTWRENLAPAHCRWPIPPEQNFIRQPAFSYQNPKLSQSVWNSQIAPAEILLAWLHARFLADYYKISIPGTDIASLLQSTTASEQLDRATWRLIKAYADNNPGQSGIETAWHNCLTALRYQFKADQYGHSLRQTDQIHLLRIEGDLLLQRYMAIRGSEQRDELIGWLLENRQARMALHLARTGLQHSVTWPPGSATTHLEAKETRRLLEFLARAYRQIQDNQSRTTIRQLDKVIAQTIAANPATLANDGARPAFSARQLAALRTELARIAGTNRFCREALLLQQAFSSTQQEKQQLQAQLEQRDEQASQVELSAAFAWLPY
ncbi:MAG: hypothetical protein KDK39_01795 [Leptospiraceae bacterium]|nr:hypothetical protein [Leptospiraceae bacterium]